MIIAAFLHCVGLVIYDGILNKRDGQGKMLFSQLGFDFLAKLLVCHINGLAKWAIAFRLCSHKISLSGKKYKGILNKIAWERQTWFGIARQRSGISMKAA
ncbi:hypothetical protein [Ferrovibrio sp.]|uniref:hypothetical protein n=1 Tax=Ferrovibrio sp. TaxID=1917215 RepID=UPI001B78A1EB|nr:hypothetical protein [Ferrovibrio sp.]MBP7065034.1 hypothetical protein [Ferrovibrio sp.]